MSGRKFVEGKGWVVEGAATPPAGQQAKKGPGAVRLAETAAPKVTRENIEAVAASFGMVLVDATEYQDTLQRLAELEQHFNEAGGAPTDPLQAVVAAIGQLEQGNSEHFTGNGVPQVGALTQLVGRKVSAKERDEAFTRFQEQQAAGQAVDPASVTLEQVDACQSLDELTNLLANVEDEALIAAGEARAEQIKAGR